jgi:hypothetical protein
VAGRDFCFRLPGRLEHLIRHDGDKRIESRMELVDPFETGGEDFHRRDRAGTDVAAQLRDARVVHLFIHWSGPP